MNHSTSSRSAPPAPLAFRTAQYGAPGCSSADYRKCKESPSYSHYTYTTTPRSYSGDYSDTSTIISDRSQVMGQHLGGPSTPRRKPTSPTSRVNANSYCGRHSSEWLFSGWSVFSRKGSS